MIRSMTGFARAETQGSWGRLTCELRSVNHRYLDLQFRLSEELRAVENDMRQAASVRMSRGKVEVQFRYTSAVMAGGDMVLDRELLHQLKRAVDVLDAEWGTASTPDPMRVLAWPGVVRPEQPDLAPMHKAACGLFEQALQAFTDMRESEGGRLLEFLTSRCDLLDELVRQVQQRIPEVRSRWPERIRARCAELGVDVDPSRLEQEVVLAAQRMDVEEEMSRLTGHVQEVRAALKRDEPVGRRLDFLMQELNREANTLSSKSQDAEMTRCAVEMKVQIEQMREQVQNIE